MKKTILLCLLLTNCTIASYRDGNLFIVDIHPGGESLGITGKLEGKGELEVARETGESSPALEAALETISRLTTP